MTGPTLHHAALPHRGGAVRVARLLAQAQREAGEDARLSFEVEENDPETLADANAAGLTPTGIPPAPAPTGIPLLGPTPPHRLAELFVQSGPQATLHLHTSTDWPALLSGLLATVPEIPRGRLLVTLHDATPLTGGCAYPLDCPHFPVCADPCPRDFPRARARQLAVAEHLARLGALLVSPSGWLAAQARAAGLKARVIPNGIPWPQELTPRNRARALLGVDPSAPVALFAAHGGARAAYKSGPDWPGYWAELRKGLPANAIAFAAGGDEAYAAHDLTVWPYVDRAKLALLMRAADVLVYPALADNHPLVLLEAASLELPVVSYAVGGVPEIVIPGVTGLLARPGDRREFLAGARALLTDAALRRRMGQAARARAGTRFTAARMHADYAALAASALSRQDSGAQLRDGK